MSEPLIYIHLEDGRVYSLPVRTVAHERAMDITERDEDTNYVDELQYLMSEEGEDQMLDHLFNNMDWYKHNPKFVRAAPPVELKDATIAKAKVGRE